MDPTKKALTHLDFMSVFAQKAKQTLVVLNTLFSGFTFVYSQGISNLLGNMTISGSTRSTVIVSEHLTVMPERYQLMQSQVLQLLTGCCGEQLANVSLSAEMGSFTFLGIPVCPSVTSALSQSKRHWQPRHRAHAL